MRTRHLLKVLTRSKRVFSEQEQTTSKNTELATEQERYKYLQETQKTQQEQLKLEQQKEVSAQEGLKLGQEKEKTKQQFLKTVRRVGSLGIGAVTSSDDESAKRGPEEADSKIEKKEDNKPQGAARKASDSKPLLNTRKRNYSTQPSMLPTHPAQAGLLLMAGLQQLVLLPSSWLQELMFTNITNQKDEHNLIDFARDPNPYKLIIPSAVRRLNLMSLLIHRPYTHDDVLCDPGTLLASIILSQDHTLLPAKPLIVLDDTILLEHLSPSPITRNFADFIASKLLTLELKNIKTLSSKGFLALNTTGQKNRLALVHDARIKSDRFSGKIYMPSRASNNKPLFSPSKNFVQVTPNTHTTKLFLSQHAQYKGKPKQQEKNLRREKQKKSAQQHKKGFR